MVEKTKKFNPNITLSIAVEELTGVKGWRIEEDGTTTPLEGNNTSAPTKENVIAKYNELIESNQYIMDRISEYPSIEELVVALYDEEDKASIIERRKAVKAKYPKSE